MNDQVQEKDNVVLGLGIASLVFGTAALPLAFIPCCGTLAIIPAGLGLLFGGIGFFIAKSRNRSGGLCTAALVVSIIAGGIALFQMIALGGMGMGAASASNSVGKSMDGREWGPLKEAVQQLQTEEGSKALYQSNPDLSQAYPSEENFLQQARLWRPKLEPLPAEMPSIFTGKISYNVSVNGGFRKVELGFTNSRGAAIASRWENGRLLMISVN